MINHILINIRAGSPALYFLKNNKKLMNINKKLLTNDN